MGEARNYTDAGIGADLHQNMNGSALGASPNALYQNSN